MHSHHGWCSLETHLSDRNNEEFPAMTGPHSTLAQHCGELRGVRWTQLYFARHTEGKYLFSLRRKKYTICSSKSFLHPFNIPKQKTKEQHVKQIGLGTFVFHSVTLHEDYVSELFRHCNVINYHCNLPLLYLALLG